jgi:alpha-ketoglutarate-dependent taurine dioxygenase
MHLKHFNDTVQYQRWRAEKLAAQVSAVGDDIVKFQAPDQLTRHEWQQLRDGLSRRNYVVYESETKYWTKQQLLSFGQQFGLKLFDKHLFGTAGVSDIQVSNNKKQGEFIPYTSRRLGWHTDGYYNPNRHWVTAIILHCNQSAAEGGINRFVDPDLLYIYLQDQDPSLISALMAEDCLSIPAYDDGAGHVRPASHGPVFWFNDEGLLQMRYTQRTTNINWSDDPVLTKARSLIDNWLEQSPDVLTYQLHPGQGVLSNNVLHCRSAFKDNEVKPRQLLRARYLDSIQLMEELEHD